MRRNKSNFQYLPHFIKNEGKKNKSNNSEMNYKNDTISKNFINTNLFQLAFVSPTFFLLLYLITNMHTFNHKRETPTK